MARAKMEETRRLFQTFDLDNSGTLSADEVLAILTRKGGTAQGLSIEDAKEIIADFDDNGDGVLSVEEFASAWATINNEPSSSTFFGSGAPAPVGVLSEAEAAREAELQQAWAAKGKAGRIPTVGLDRTTPVDPLWWDQPWFDAWVESGCDHQQLGISVAVRS